MTLRRSSLAGLLVTGLALTACSSSGGGGTPTTAPPTTQASTATTSAVTTPTAPTTAGSGTSSGTGPSHDALAAVVLQQADVPTGYTAQPPSSSTDEEANQAKVVACVGSTSVDPAARIEEVHSNDYVKQPQTISSDATSYTSQDAVSALVSVIQNDKAESCFDTLLREQVAATGGTVDSSNITITSGNNGGPSNVVAVLQGTVKLTSQGQQATVNIVEIFIQGRQVLATVSGQATNTTVDVPSLQHAATAVAGRAATA